MGSAIRIYDLGPSRLLNRQRVLFGAPAFTSIGWMTEQTVEVWLGEWWRAIPFGYLTVGLIIFWAGNALADWKNDRSRLKQWWYQNIAFFELVDVVPVFEIVDSEKNFIVRAKIRFTRKIAACDGLLKIMSKHSSDVESVAFWSSRKFNAGEHAIIDIANISSKSPSPRHASYWGRDESKPVLENGKYVVDVKITSGGRTQAFKVRIDMFQKGTGTSGRFWLSDDSTEIFAL